MTKALTIAALLAVTPALAGCDFFDILQGKQPKGQQNAMATQAEMRANTEAVLGFLAEPEPVVSEPEPVAVVPEPEPVDPGPPPFVCETIFRIQTCDEGVLYMLDSNMNWILPGRTE